MITSRDKKILMILVPIVLIGAFVFLVMKPMREEASRAQDELTQQRQAFEAAEAKERELQAAKRDFPTDYASVVRLGKAIPTTVDTPSVLVQLERAAKGTGIDFTKVTVGERVAASGGAGASGGASASSSSSSESGSAAGAGGTAGGAAAGGAQPVEAGGAGAQSTPGKTVEKANNGAAAASESAQQSSETDTTSSTSTREGGLPVGGGAAGGSSGQTGAGPASLDRVPLTLAFEGDFFKLADFFHRLKRFVRTVEGQVAVRGRLLTIDSFTFSSSEDFPKLEAELMATMYLAPKSEGATAGASPSGPPAGASTGSQPAGATASADSAASSPPAGGDGAQPGGAAASGDAAQ